MNVMTDFLEDTPEREIATKRSTWVSTAVNLSFTVAQMAAGIFPGSQGLIADGIHSLSNLAVDFVVLFAVHHSKKGQAVTSITENWTEWLYWVASGHPQQT